VSDLKEDVKKQLKELKENWNKQINEIKRPCSIWKRNSIQI
jgi:hypothetical protein